MTNTWTITITTDPLGPSHWRVSYSNRTTSGTSKTLNEALIDAAQAAEEMLSPDWFVSNPEQE